jgi:hypothetical protein
MNVSARVVSFFAGTASVEAAETNLDASRVVLELDDSSHHGETEVRNNPPGCRNTVCILLYGLTAKEGALADERAHRDEGKMT